MARAYLAEHPYTGRPADHCSKNMHAKLHDAIARLIDQGELVWDSATRMTTVTRRGEMMAKRIERFGPWYLNNPWCEE
jgi:hypothetical protein